MHTELKEIAPPLHEAGELTPTTSDSNAESSDALVTIVRGHDAKMASLATKHRAELLRYRVALALTLSTSLALALLLAFSERTALGRTGVCRWPEAAQTHVAALVDSTASPPLGPGHATAECQQAVYEEYSSSKTASHTARPFTFEAETAHLHRAFDDVSWVRLPAGVVSRPWSCRAGHCFDGDESDERGFAYLWVPKGVARNATRLMYVHGGSWSVAPSAAHDLSPRGCNTKTPRLTAARVRVPRG
eukprot:5221858-Prymnesium_polylepis.1